MYRLRILLLAFGLWLPGATVGGQEEPPIVEISGPDESKLGFTCDWHPFEAVEVDLRAQGVEFEAGKTALFSGNVRHNQEFPLVGGTLYLQVYRVSVGDGQLPRLVDQFAYPKTLDLDSFTEVPVTVGWPVPRGASSGQYVLIPHMVSQEGGGLDESYYRSVPLLERGAGFRVRGTASGSISFDPTRASINGQTLAPETEFAPDTALVARVVLENGSDHQKELRVLWEEYVGNGIQPKTRLAQREETVTLPAGGNLELAYEMSSLSTHRSFLMVKASDDDVVAVQNLAVKRQGGDEERIGAVTLDAFPIRKGRPANIAGCISLGSLAGGEALEVSLLDVAGKELYATRFESGLQAGMNRLSRDFTPGTSASVVGLTATLKRGEAILDTVRLTYSCASLYGSDCSQADPEPAAAGARSTPKEIGAYLLVGLFLLALLAIAVRGVAGRRRLASLLGALMSGGAALFLVPDAQAARIHVQWVNIGGSALQATSSHCPAGTIWSGLLDDQQNSLYHIGEEDERSGFTQQCLSIDDPRFSLLAEWVTGNCPAEMSFSGVYDDAGSNSDNDDKPWVHSTNEENYRPDSSFAYRWCLGVTGDPDARLELRWVRWGSSAKNPPCAADETRLLAGRDGRRNLNSSDKNGNNQESLCARIVTDAPPVPPVPPVNNDRPHPPLVDGPAHVPTGLTPYDYTALAHDPDQDNLIYEFDFDYDGAMGGMFDQVTPGSGSVPSGTPSMVQRGWAIEGTHTFQVRAREIYADGTQGQASDWTPYTVVSSSGPRNAWCNGPAGGFDTEPEPNWMTGTLCWPGPQSDVIVGPNLDPASNGIYPYTWQWTCYGTNGGTDAFCQAGYIGPPPAGPSPTLKICENSCNSGINPPSFTMAQGATKSLVACWNASNHCDDSNGNVTNGGTNWSESGGSTISLSGSDPKVVTATGPGTESVSASYGGQTVTKPVTVACIDPGACARDARQADYCTSQTFSVTDTCGQTQSCRGTKSCDFNWREVAP